MIPFRSDANGNSQNHVKYQKTDSGQLGVAGKIIRCLLASVAIYLVALVAISVFDVVRSEPRLPALSEIKSMRAVFGTAEPGVLREVAPSQWNAILNSLQPATSCDCPEGGASGSLEITLQSGEDLQVYLYDSLNT